jgi:hypothetical protein
MACLYEFNREIRGPLGGKLEPYSPPIELGQIWVNTAKLTCCSSINPYPQVEIVALDGKRTYGNVSIAMRNGAVDGEVKG